MTFVNELGVEEAGIDGGGIFKDFMEKITRAAFDVQYGLFKVIYLVLLTKVFVDFINYLTPSCLHVVVFLSLNLVNAFFQETADHMLYPNPGSGMIHDQHLQFFHFLGSLLAKVWCLIGWP